MAPIRIPQFTFRNCACVLLWLIAGVSHAQSLDPLISAPDLWQTSGADFVDQHADLGFHWLSDARDQAETRLKGVTLFGSPVYQTDAAFQSGKLSGITVSIYNRGDAGDLEREQMSTLVNRTRDAITAMARVQPALQGQDASDAVKAWSFAWQTPASKIFLEFSFTREVKSRSIPFRAEFIRLQITPLQKPQTFMAAALASASPDAVFNGPSHVHKDPGGDVLIQTVPMVDQGQKGYCVVASAERVLRYYGIPVDENELAELANSSATQGTSNEAMFDSLKKLAQRLRVRTRTIQSLDVHQVLDLMREYNQVARRQHAQEIPDQGQVLNVWHIYSLMQPDILIQARTRNKADVNRFQQTVQDNIDQGIPVLWSVMLGLIHEDKAPLGLGGHMRLIIGYNSQTGEILYTDSWGPGHELKRMSANNAWTITTALNTIEPL